MTGRHAPSPKQMDKPFSAPAKAVFANGREYPVRTDFRIWTHIAGILWNSEMSEEEKIIKILLLGYKDEIPKDPDAAVSALLGFFSPGEGEKRESGKNGVRAVSFDKDEGEIYASFMACYGIDLYEAELHWHKFLHLFAALPADSAIKKIIGYRSADVSGIKNAHEKQFIRMMKRRYALSQTVSDGDIASALDGDVSGKER